MYHNYRLLLCEHRCCHVPGNTLHELHLANEGAPILLLCDTCNQFVFFSSPICLIEKTHCESTARNLSQWNPPQPRLRSKQTRWIKSPRRLTVREMSSLNSLSFPNDFLSYVMSNRCWSEKAEDRAPLVPWGRGSVKKVWKWGGKNVIWHLSTLETPASV